MYPLLKNTVNELKNSFTEIPSERKILLDDIAEKLGNWLKNRNEAPLIYICTHNSRRSQMAQIWMWLALKEAGLTHISVWSGGTEATAFHPNAQKAMSSAGFLIHDIGGQKVTVLSSDHDDPLVCDSALFTDFTKKLPEFAAIMTCDDADHNCPFVPGASLRISQTYTDPKWSDNSDETEKVYFTTSLMIGREQFYITQQLQNFL